MSYAAQTWARKLKVGNGIAKAILRHLADVADGDGCSHYGFEALCSEVEFTPRAVTRGVAFLIKHGFLEKTVRRTGGDKGRWLAPLWRVLLPGLTPADSHPQTEAEGVRINPLESAGVNLVYPCESAPPNLVYPCESAPLNLAFTPADSQGNPLRESKKKKESPSDSLAHKCAKASKATIDEWFDKFWGEYPRKVDKPRARRAYATALNKLASTIEGEDLRDFDVLEALDDAKENDHRFREDGDPKYIPYPASWLNSIEWIEFKNRPDPYLVVKAQREAAEAAAHA